MTLALTVGTNTYVSLADATLYVERLYGPRVDAWNAALTATKNALLAQATLDIDAHVWRGFKTDDAQRLEFPRDGEATTDSSYTLVEQATVEQALFLLSSNAECRASLQAQGVSSFSVGGLSESYRAGGVQTLSPRSRQLLKDWEITMAAVL
jgi:hypothetical protein